LTIVRVQIHRLRQKLEEYYAAEGLHDPILVTIPKGCYLPAFEALSQSVPTAPEIAPLTSPPPVTEVLAAEEASAPFTESAPAANKEPHRRFSGAVRTAAATVLLAVICLLIGWSLGKRSEADRGNRSSSPAPARDSRHPHAKMENRQNPRRRTGPHPAC
jgi:hypothetical protein